MNGFQSICIYCGSRDGYDDIHREQAAAMGGLVADAGLQLIYGGGGVGLMGTMAKAALDKGGEVTGVITRSLARAERPPADLTRIMFTDSLNDRKSLMFKMSDAFVALPGGTGTLDEVVDLMLWQQLGFHNKPLILVNINEFWQPFLDMLRHFSRAGFGHAALETSIITVEDVTGVLPALTGIERAEIVSHPELF